jgi:hypothetical protein
MVSRAAFGTGSVGAWVAAAALSLTMLSGCGGGPLGVLPGGKLSGDPAAVPGNWDAAGEYGFMQLETDPSAPYSVNIAYTVIDGVVYVNAGDTETQWVKNMDSDPRVLIGLDGAIYPLRAERVTASAEIARFGKVWTSQSSFHRDPAGLDQAWVYRLVPR